LSSFKSSNELKRASEPPSMCQACPLASGITRLQKPGKPMNTRYRIKATCLIIASLACLPLAASAENALAPVPVHAFDSIFSELDSPNKPAAAVAVLKEGKVIYQKSFGSVNLEYKIPANLNTKFQVDSLAWEFIAFAALKLEEQGKIRLDDDIRKYLPEIPDFGKKITINHLLSSTDGLYGYKALRSLSGVESKEPELSSGVLQLAKKQTRLNFNPGEAFSPGGDTRLILLAKIVEVASGLPFDAYCKQHIFLPLGMSDTLFVYDSGQLLQNTALPYRDAGQGVYKHDGGNGHAAGPANLYSSINDLAIWRAQHAARSPGANALTNKLNAPIKLDNGATIKDISSISTYGQQHAGQERGIRKIYQIGSFGGYASSVFRFPEQDIAVIVLSSGLAYNGSYGMRAASLLLKQHFTEAETIDYSTIAGIRLSPAQLLNYAGHYWNPARAISAKIHLKNNVLYYTRTEGSDGRALIPLSDSSFQVTIEGDDKYIIKFKNKGDQRDLHFIMGNSDPVVFEPYQPAVYTNDELAQFAGVFYCKELNSTFLVEENQGILTAHHAGTGTVTFRPISTDLFSGNRRFMNGIKFIRGSDNAITGFRIVIDEVRHLEFKRVRSDDSRKLPKAALGTAPRNRSPSLPS
jgi:CubicO group peptidase (beta-lactamase class C family)